MSDHTPGPWISDKDGWVWAPDDTAVCFCKTNCMPVAIARLNARLIAAAPELLEACRATVATIERNWGALPNAPGVREFLGGILRHNKRAIAKAEGNSHE